MKKIKGIILIISMFFITSCGIEHSKEESTKEIKPKVEKQKIVKKEKKDENKSASKAKKKKKKISSKQRTKVTSSAEKENINTVDSSNATSSTSSVQSLNPPQNEVQSSVPPGVDPVTGMGRCLSYDEMTPEQRKAWDEAYKQLEEQENNNEEEWNDEGTSIDEEVGMTSYDMLTEAEKQELNELMNSGATSGRIQSWWIEHDRLHANQ